MAHAALILAPGPDASPPATAALVPALAALGLIGAPHGAARFAPGPRFAQLVCFLGCSPTLNASDDGRPGFLEIEVTPDPRVILHGIEEGIALPADELLAALAAIGGGQWRYRYRTGDPPLSR